MTTHSLPDEGPGVRRETEAQCPPGLPGREGAAVFFNCRSGEITPRWWALFFLKS